MLYTVVDWQRRLLERWLAALRLGAELPPWQRVLMAQHTLIERTLQAGDGAPVPIEAAVARDHPGVTRAVAVEEAPFSRLVRLRGAKSRPAVFVVAPYSGYAGAVLGELAASILPIGEVYFLEWTDARQVPTAFGDFGLEEQLAVVLGALRLIDGPVHLVGVSQSGAATLAVAALAAAANDPTSRPRSLTLLGSPIGASQVHSAADWLLASVELVRLEQQLLAVVPDRYPGAGRRVYPGVFQLLALSLTHPASYLEAQAGLWAELVSDTPGLYDRLHGDLHRVADVPAELFTQTIEQLVRRPALSAAGLRIGGREIPLAGVRQLPVLTIEAGRDGLVGAGATHAAQALGGRGSATLTVETAAHHALFTGPTFARAVAPALHRFFAEFG